MFRSTISSRLSPLLESVSPQKAAFYGHLMTLVFATIYIIPFEFLGLGVLKRPAYLASLWTNLLTMLWTIKSNYGAPPMPQISGYSMTALKQSFQSSAMTLAPWLQKAMNGVDFHFVFFVLIFISAYPSVWALCILGRRSLWSVCSYCSKNTPESRLWKLCAGSWDKLKAREAEVLHYSVLGEILLGMWLVVSIALPSRQFLTTILYWNFLKTRYQVPRSHELHLKVWQQLGAQVDPVFKKVPILQKPLDLAKGWFQPQLA
eukprot:CAMPEP_0115138644 /NCGR_PEP_ID=MMETSP0227-20121206/57793_1 /TAXON_ID=89957 /ORGANISM="Polarella glacialis, Strain CCMP 1383" /LENGTH=260 /DNA_ID=CAMNT_0002546311 /DNA_START=103 /DNA_END=885 /DNA_ORIENTATION=+